jgi:hypothetical protein
MNQGVDAAHQTLKYTKAKMREIIARIEANQEDHGHSLDTKVSTIRDLIHPLALIVPSHSQ